MVDSHCHLADEAFVADLPAVVDRAVGAGLVEALCIVAPDEEPEMERAARVVELWPAVRVALGVHPHRAAPFAGDPEAARRTVEAALALQPAARAVGEIGLDYHYGFAPREVQRAVFAAQVRLARERALPVVIHTREAESDTLAVLEDDGGGEVQGVFHCFTGDAALARRVVDLGFHVSFSGILTFPRAQTIRDAAAGVPVNRLLVETDSPYLAPVPHRGKRNEPAWVVRTLMALAETRGETATSLGAAVLATYRALFRP